MDLDKQQIVLETLRALGPKAGSRLVLSVTRVPETQEPEPDPKDYDSGTAYRAALIQRNTNLGKVALDGLAERLRNRALTVAPAHLSNALVIEGNLEQLAEAMAEPEVRDAIPDLPLGSPDGKPVTTD